MAELEQSFDEHDPSENPENSECEEDTVQYDISGIPENSEPDEDSVQHDISGIPENSEPEEDNVQHDICGTPENSQPKVENVQAENDSQPKEKEEQNNTVLRGGEIRWPGWPGESVFRLLVPTQKVGGIIGHKGEFIKKMCEETRARIKILDGPRGNAERAVLVSAKEEPDASVPPAIDGLLRVLKRVVDGLESDPSGAPPVMSGKVSTRLLAPATQAGSLIGKQGTTIKSIQEASGCIVRVLGAEELPVFALQEDRIVEVVGEPLEVQKAVELIASHLRKFLVDRSIIPVFEMQMQMPNPQMEQYMPPAQHWGPPPQAFPRDTGYGRSPHHMPPPRQHDNYYPPAEIPPPMEKHHHGISAYGREAPASMHAPSNAQPAPSMITQVTQQMQIPLSYADAVIGSAGSSISYIRRASGATVVIQETRGVPGEMTVEISGTASQVQTAQQLVQNSMAEAAAAGSTQAPPTDQGYNPYVAPPSSAAQTGVYGQNTGYGQAGGAYGSAYGANYGY